MIDRTQNLSDMKSRILSYMKVHGPCLPIHISKETKTSHLLASAFLSDLASEKIIKISYMKVGGSPLYFLPGQEQMLENFEKFLNHKEREALSLLKKSKILEDEEQEPSIRVALKAIKDFALPYTVTFQEKHITFWQYFSLSEDEARNLISEKLEKLQPKSVQEIEKKVEIIEEQKIEAKIAEEVKKNPEVKIEEIIAKIEEKKPETKIEPIFKEETKPKIKKIKREKPKSDKFLEEIKLFLAKRNLEMVRVEKYDKKEVSAIVKEAGKELWLHALNKKKIDASDLLKAYKKANSLNLPYLIFTRGDASKKLSESISALKALERIDKI